MSSEPSPVSNLLPEFSEPRIIWGRPDSLCRYGDELDLPRLSAIRAELNSPLTRDFWNELRKCLGRLPFGSELKQRSGDMQTAVDQDCLTIGKAGQLLDDELAALQSAIRLLIPWRKGPIRIFDHLIDAEWRSDKKWARIAPALDSLEGKRLADIGCNNGYYLWRASAAGPELALGFDPSEPFYFAFELLQRFLQNPALQYERLGIEHCDLFPQFFDVVLCLGVIYHQRNPLEMIAKLHSCLKKGGQLIIETQAIPGDEPVALFPRDRYAKARNVYFVPTASCLEAWLMRAGFREIETFSIETVTTEEQRKTDFAPYESLEDYLSKDDPSKTVEGHPAPLRVAVRARK